MSSHAHAGHPVEIKNPGVLKNVGGAMGAFGALAVIGALLFIVGLKGDPKSAWAGFLHGHFYFMSIALGGLFFVAIHWATNAMWSAPIRRIAEAFTSYIPVLFVTFLIIYYGHHELYSWSHPEHVQGDLVLEGKKGYLSSTFFLIRNLVAIGLWWLFAHNMVKNSLAQDSTKDFGFSLKNRVWAPAFLMVFALTFTMASFDQMMSLDPHWFSTIFGVYCFAGVLYSTYALLGLMMKLLHSKGYLKDMINDNHFHDIGKFMFAWTVFWAYIGFSQFMLIWYANLPEETGYYLRRMEGGWLNVSIFLLVGKFVAPLLILMKRSAKRCTKLLTAVTVYMLLMQWVDVLWLVQPEFFKTGPQISLAYLGGTLLLLGVFGICVFRFLSKHNVVAMGDHRLEESVLHHHQ